MAAVDVEIPDNSIGWGIGVLGAIVAWLVRLEARLNARPTRQEQEVIAEKVATDLNKRFDKLEQMLNNQNKDTSEHRQWVGDSLGTIRTQIAVVRAKMGDSLDDTERHRLVK